MSLLDKVTSFLDEKLSAPMAKLSEQRHLRAVRDGIVSTLPLIIIGAMFLMVAFPPIPDDWGFKIWLGKTGDDGVTNVVKVLYTYRISMYIMGLYAAWGLGYSLALSYDLKGHLGGNIAVIGFLLTLIPGVREAGGFGIPLAQLGGGSMFVMIITSILAIELWRNILRFLPEMSEDDDNLIAVLKNSLINIIPMLVPILVISFITFQIGFEWHTFINELVAPIVSASDTLPGVLFLVFLITFFWSFGIHGVSVVGAVARPAWIVLRDENMAAFEAGLPLPNIATEEFFQWFIWIGGSGATLGLVILLVLRSKSQYGKQLGRACVGPAIFNINEPIIFGAPIILNPILMIPFMLAPMIMATIAWFTISSGLVSTAFITAPWTFPGPIGAFIATGGTLSGAILNISLILVSVLVYYPFFKIYDKQLLEQE